MNPLWKPRKGDRVVIVKGWYAGFCGTIIKFDKKENQYQVTDLVRYKKDKKKPEDLSAVKLHFPLSCLQPFRHFKHLAPYIEEIN